MRFKCKTCWKSSTLKRSLLQRRGNWPKLRPGRLQHIPRVLSVPGVLLSLLRKAEQVYSFLTTLVDSFLGALQAEIAPHNPHPSSHEDTQPPSYLPGATAQTFPLGLHAVARCLDIKHEKVQGENSSVLVACGQESTVSIRLTKTVELRKVTRRYLTF